MTPNLLYKNLTLKIPSNKDQFCLIESKFKSLFIKLRIGEVANHLVFINKGALRLHTIDDKGHENIILLEIEDYSVCQTYIAF